MIIKQDEMDDFKAIIVKNKFQVNDFEIKDEDMSTKPLYAEKIKITVTRKSNGKQKIYDGGHVTSWNNDFENDLKLGVFGCP